MSWRQSCRRSRGSRTSCRSMWGSWSSRTTTWSGPSGAHSLLWRSVCQFFLFFLTGSLLLNLIVNPVRFECGSGPDTTWQLEPEVKECTGRCSTWKLSAEERLFERNCILSCQVLFRTLLNSGNLTCCRVQKFILNTFDIFERRFWGRDGRKNEVAMQPLDSLLSPFNP
jgi:hypothetical protein